MLPIGVGGAITIDGWVGIWIVWSRRRCRVVSNEVGLWETNNEWEQQYGMEKIVV